jgi:hypothetical protein
MAYSSKYEKLVEYLKTHYTYNRKLKNFAVGNREDAEIAVKVKIYDQLMGYVETLDEQERIQTKHKSNLIPVEFPVNAAEPVSLDFKPDVITFGSSLPDSINLGYIRGEEGNDSITILGESKDTITFGDGSDTLHLGPTRLPGGAGEDHIVFNSGLAHTHYDEPEYYSDTFGFVAGELPDDKDDK